jgi:hypothetical protein
MYIGSLVFAKMLGILLLILFIWVSCVLLEILIDPNFPDDVSVSLGPRGAAKKAAPEEDLGRWPKVAPVAVPFSGRANGSALRGARSASASPAGAELDFLIFRSFFKSSKG